MEEQQQLSFDNSVTSEKRKLSENSFQDYANKKQRIFSLKDFRKNIGTKNRLAALSEFLKVVKEKTKHDYVAEYLDQGGNCLELLQTLEVDSAVPPILVFELVTYILLKITEKCHKYQSSAYEACRYMLNNYITVINKMISMSSTTPERKVCLKLLTAIVTFSTNLAKDVLVNVNIRSANLELLTKHTEEKNSVRNHFIHFLTAFLIDGHYPALSMLLEKKGIITSIIRGLKFDSADTVCIVITAMKNHILENPLVSKTSKMKTFNTIVVRDIVNLYNWKGPEGFKAQKHNKETNAVVVDEIQKSKVNESVHNFLLTLCTSPKYGVIFKDRLVGLGKKNQNALMYTVLESLDRPWDHSYASELVLKICGACPALSKTMWNNLKTYLEPRWTQKWLKSMAFAKNLIKEVGPKCIEYCIHDMNITQLFQVVQMLVAPIPIFKTVISEIQTFNSLSIKHQVLLLILEMITALKKYLEELQKSLSTDDFNKFKSFVSNYVNKNFPYSSLILKEWDTVDDNVESEKDFSKLEYVDTVLNIFKVYKDMSPSLLEDLNSNSIDLRTILTKLQQLENIDKASQIQIKFLDIFVDLDFSKFTPNSDLFAYIAPILLKFYYENQDKLAKNVLKKLLANSGIFDGCLYEINIWNNGILDLKHFDEDCANTIVEIFQLTYHSLPEYLDELSCIAMNQGKPLGHSYVLNNLQDLEFEKSTSNIIIKHRNLSPMILGLGKYLEKGECTKSLKIYVNFVLLNLLHCQTEIEVFSTILERFDSLASNSFKSYVSSWQNCEEIVRLKKSKGRLQLFQQFSEGFLGGNIDSFLENVPIDPNIELQLNLVDCGIFYINNLLLNNLLTSEIVDCFEKFINYLIQEKMLNEEVVEKLFGNPILFQQVNFLNCEKENSKGYLTKFLISLVKNCKNIVVGFDRYLKLYKEKLLENLFKIVRKPHKYNFTQLVNILDVFELDYQECQKILQSLSNLFVYYNEFSDNIFQILMYSLKQLVDFCKENLRLEPLSKEVIQNLTHYLSHLCKNNKTNVNNLSSIFYEYLLVYPHSIEYIHESLFESLLLITEYHKDNVSLLTYLLQKNLNYTQKIKSNLDIISSKKAMILSIITVLVDKDIDENLLKGIYKNFEVTLMKVLEKPQKAGQYFQTNCEPVLFLLDEYFPLEICEKIVTKVQKYEVTEVFHVQMLSTVFKKILRQENVNPKIIHNIIMTLIHLQLNVLKKGLSLEENVCKVDKITKVFCDLLEKMEGLTSTLDLSSICSNESTKLFYKFCLKYGISGSSSLLKFLKSLVKLLIQNLQKQEAKMILEMLLSHSEFLPSVLGEHNEITLEIWSLFWLLCEHWNEFMERNHIPVLLSSYRAMVNSCDKIILKLLRMYEKNATQTKFYDFKPFLWGRAAATHYSVRVNIETILLRQPKTGDILDILQEDIVRSTIVSYPLNNTLTNKDEFRQDIKKCYDLSFMLPLFSQLLAPEQQIATYKFTRTGALSLTVVALSSQNKEIRQAACHVLSRFNAQVEARQGGKDNLLWIRYVEAVCRGTAYLPDYKLNNFAAIYLSRMALVLTHPNHVMYLPLSNHLLAKASLDFSTIPELYTFLHSSDVNYKEHRNFILELLRDGLRTEKDFIDFMRSMAFKLFSELYASSVSDIETKLLVLEVLQVVSKLPIAVKMLTQNHSLLAQVSLDLTKIVKGSRKDKYSSSFIDRIIDIILAIIRVLEDQNINFMAFLMLKNIISDQYFCLLKKDNKKALFQCLFIIYTHDPSLFTEDLIKILLEKTEDALSWYLYKYGCQFVDVESIDISSENYYLRLLIHMFKNKKLGT